MLSLIVLQVVVYSAEAKNKDLRRYKQMATMAKVCTEL